jgi:Ca2+-binding EF-hand superfamily protein
MNYGNIPLVVPKEEKKEDVFPNGKSQLEFDEFINIIKDSCSDKDQAENYLIHAFSMFDRKK